MIFNFFKKRLHLRHVLQIAILIEQEGEKFYGQLAEISSDTKVKELCIRLAEDEADHKKSFEEALSRWLHLSADEEYLQSYIQKLKKKGLFSTPLPGASVGELLKYAVEYEHKTVDFYKSLERKFPELWKQMHIHQLVRVEREHADRLKSLM